MSTPSLQTVIEALWTNRDTLNSATTGAPREAVDRALAELESGRLRVAAPKADGSGWEVQDWLI